MKVKENKKKVKSLEPSPFVQEHEQQEEQEEELNPPPLLLRIIGQGSWILS